jgi:hypothetical protein
MVSGSEGDVGSKNDKGGKQTVTFTVNQLDSTKVTIVTCRATYICTGSVDAAQL